MLTLFVMIFLIVLLCVLCTLIGLNIGEANGAGPAIVVGASAVFAAIVLLLYANNGSQYEDIINCIDNNGKTEYCVETYWATIHSTDSYFLKHIGFEETKK